MKFIWESAPYVRFGEAFTCDTSLGRFYVKRAVKLSRYFISKHNGVQFGGEWPSLFYAKQACEAKYAKLKAGEKA